MGGKSAPGWHKNEIEKALYCGPRVNSPVQWYGWEYWTCLPISTHTPQGSLMVTSTDPFQPYQEEEESFGKSNRGVTTKTLPSIYVNYMVLIYSC